MQIYEDYFDKIEITDDDISNDETIGGMFGNDDAETLIHRLRTKYERCIVIEMLERNFELFTDRLIWKITVPECLKRVCYVLDAYNVEYEYVFRTMTASSTLHMEKIGQYNILTADDINKKRNGFIIFYVNFPEFSYKESYYFITRLCNAMWKTISSKSLFRELSISKKNIELCGSIISNKLDASMMIHLYPDGHNKLYPTLPFMSFFYRALKCFHNTQEDSDRIKEMQKQIEHGVNPFANK